MFDLLPLRIELEIVRVIDTPEATHIRYRVVRKSDVACDDRAGHDADEGR